MNNKKSIIFLAIVAMIFSLSSCEKKWDDPEFDTPTYTGKKANKKISDIKAQHTLGNYQQDSICSFDSRFLIEAVVISSDEGGNCYKYLTVRDATGGIEIAIDRSGLYNEYPVGQKIMLDCRGLIVGDYHNKYQIGWIYNGSVGRINGLFLDKYIYKVGLPQAVKPTTYKDGASLSLDSVNTLVTLQNCRFSADLDGKQLATDDIIIDRTIMLGSTEMVVRTSNYAKFRNIIINADKDYDLTGILSVYNQEYQLILRTKEDFQFSEEKLISNYSFNDHSLTSDGWSTYSVFSNAAWSFVNFQSENFMFHDKNESADNTDDWLISPVFTVANYNNAQLCLTHKLNIEGSLPEYYQVYYSSSYNGSFNENDWTAFSPNLTNYPSDSFGESNMLDLNQVGSSSFRIALRYNKNANVPSVRWYVDGLKIYKK